MASASPHAEAAYPPALGGACDPQGACHEQNERLDLSLEGVHRKDQAAFGAKEGLRVEIHASARGGGSAGDDAVRMHTSSTLRRTMLRMPAIFITFCIEMVVGFVISRYQATLNRYPLLISFQPVISAISGNVGLQSSSIVVRSLALGLASERKFVQSARPELKVGLCIATCMSLLVGGTAFVWYAPLPRGDDGHTWHGASTFGVTIGLGVFVSMLIAAVSGTAAPLLSKRCGFDPSAMGGPMETAFQDVVGSTFLLAVSSALLNSFGDHVSSCPGGSPQACISACAMGPGNATAALYSPACLAQCLDDIASGLC